MCIIRSNNAVSYTHLQRTCKVYTREDFGTGNSCVRDGHRQRKKFEKARLLDKYKVTTTTCGANTHNTRIQVSSLQIDEQTCGIYKTIKRSRYNIN